MKNSSKRGQMAVFVLLIMLLGLTVGLSATSRTLQDLKSTSVSDQSSRAFTAAEAGLEDALTKNLLGATNASPFTGSVDINGLTASYRVTRSSGNIYIPAKQIAQNEALTLNLDQYAGNIIVYWNKPNDLTGTPSCSGDGLSTRAAIEITYYGKTGNNFTVVKKAYNDRQCTIANGFASGNNATSDPNPAGFNSKTVAVVIPNNNSAVLRIKPLYNNASVAVLANGSLPEQDYIISSAATSSTIDDFAKRAVQVTRSMGTLPPIFDYVLFGGGSGIVQ